MIGPEKGESPNMSTLEGLVNWCNGRNISYAKRELAAVLEIEKNSIADRFGEKYFYTGYLQYVKFTDSFWGTLGFTEVKPQPQFPAPIGPTCTVNIINATSAQPHILQVYLYPAGFPLGLDGIGSTDPKVERSSDSLTNGVRFTLTDSLQNNEWDCALTLAQANVFTSGPARVPAL